MTPWRGRKPVRSGRITVTGIPDTASIATKTAARESARSATPPEPGKAATRGVSLAPIVVLTYANAGGAKLAVLLGEYADLARTSGTGLLPLCGQALSTWRLIEGGRTSSLAVASVRALATGMINSMLVRSGASQWYETAVAQVDNADALLRVYPETRFVCLHRSAADVIFAMLRGDGWGPMGPAFARYVSSHPANPIAAVAAYWTEHAGPLLEFERAHPDICRRVTFEDLIANPDDLARDLAAFLGLGPPRDLPALPDNPEDEADGESDGAGPRFGADTPGCGSAVPVRQIPAPLLAEVNRLHAELGYAPLTTDD